jgi:ABC-type bacteriocin/lantibiotic exporters, contain an N-terminal double-glycine peptidase domain
MRAYLKNIANIFRFYYSYTGAKLFVLILLSALTGLLEGVGISMLFPILTSFSNKSSVSTSNPGTNIFQKIAGFFHLQATQRNLIILFITSFILKAIVKYLVGLYKTKLSANLLKRIRFDFISGFVNLDYLYYSKLDSGKISNTFTLELERSVSGFIYFCNYVVGLFTGLAFLSMVFFIDVKFTVIIIAAGVLYYLSFSGINKAISNYSKKITFENSGFNSLLIQFVQSFKYLKSTNSFGSMKKMLESNVDSIRRLKFDMDMRASLVVAMQEPMVLLLILGVVYINVVLFNISMGSIVIILLLFYRSINYLLSSQSVWNNFISQIGSTESVIRLKKDLTGNIESVKGNTNIMFDCGIQLKGVSFSYGEKPTLKNVDLKIPKNQTIALIGRSGSGKSTLVNLITGLLKPDKGELLIDGISIDKIDIGEWRKKIGYITQETIIFNDTIENNITLWDEFKAQHEQNYQEAIEKSQLTALMDEHTNGEKIIGDRGIMLSGGQRQRIAIARELYKKPTLLILDEATSALDSETEMYIQRSIDELKGKLTIIIVAHRLSTIKHADRVVVFEHGEIVETGTFNELASIPQSKLNNFVKLQKL